ncbi:MAG: TdeIII family type II restriction endonuclease [Methanoregula sp.]|nr:TdeIII family type II restriction endonuclease [Methanoregula sp.]
MPAILPITRTKIKAYLEVFIENLVREYKDKTFSVFESPSQYLAHESRKGEIKPFHAAIIPVQIMRISAFERSFSTTLGTTFEECAKLIALDHHPEAVRGYDISGEISTQAINEIEHQVARFEHAAEEKGKKPTLDQMIEAVQKAERKDDLATRTVRADLFIRTKEGTQYFFEMKSPVPNKGQCLEVTQRILRIHQLTKKIRPEVQAYFAMAYNPYGTARKDYRWSFAINYTPFDQSVIIGQEFWNIVGGPTAYTELLEIYQEVGREKSKFMLDALAFGF